ncbi:LysM peptidoglycan-binding and 3D domain-containing protein [Planococcus halocryophilus]|uniref:LysM peptidoglycan-binding and 3D domain-containing protein n=1 Tax=Planococcus halocryophilus TaxID=1215089 RepID=UPI001F0E015C|nr:LysM peptidoglycan-binding and 3D domain-containing protein [Planococcus halocryophilus]MCH4825923.1 LysM peptidoglycan-binding domain-containing protein [Planococcus halocryophilus]
MKKLLMVLSFALILFLGTSIESSAASNVYIVKSGDSLYKISKMNNVSVGNLKAWNGLKSNTIYPNQKLKLKKATVKTVSKKATASKSGSSTVYTVKRGDTLYKISKSQKVSVSNLKAWNGLKSSTIYPNQKLKLNKTAATPVSKKTTPSRSTSGSVAKEFTVSATAYTAYCRGCSGITKTGINLKKNPGLKVIAVDPRVIPLGSKVHVEGYGYAVAGDTGSAIKGNKIDVFIPTQSNALRWGRKNVKIKILN